MDEMRVFHGGVSNCRRRRMEGGRERYLSNRVYRGDIGGFYNENTNTGSFGFYVKSGPIVCITKNKIVFRTRNTVNDRDGPVAGVIFCVIMVNENNNKNN